ncbi:MAG: hypothetical protein VCD00_15060 [Candidatus Hydrogenedentota bacterium]
MQSEDRPIHFSTELLFPTRAIPKPDLQKFYYELSQIPGLNYDSSQFGQAPLARFVTKRAPKAQSSVVVIPDRIGIVEEWVDIPMSDFIQKVGAIGTQAQADLSIDTYQAQTVLIRTTFGLTHFEDSRIFLIDHACNQRDRINPFFKRPMKSAGLRFVLPATGTDAGTLYLIIEPFRDSPRELFVEVKGIFSGQHTPLATQDAWESNIQTCRDFISQNIFPFLNQYDTPQAQS